jgi:hypothetical protein
MHDTYGMWETEHNIWVSKHAGKKKYVGNLEVYMRTVVKYFQTKKVWEYRLDSSGSA